MELDADVLIVGGGLAGLTCAIHLCKLGRKVILIEKSQYPHHKVCGEYISNEVIPYLQWLDADPEVLNPTNIDQFQFSTVNGQCVTSKLPLGGFGISRYTFDHFLFQKAKQQGCKIIIDTVIEIKYENDQFSVSTATQNYNAKFVLGAYGKRATLDHKLNRNFIAHKSNWLAIKAHYKGDFPSNLVALHHFKGGYCGVSKVEDDLINICYLVTYESFKKHKDILSHQIEVLYQNKHLKQLLTGSEIQFETPLSISQIAFDNKEQVKDHILMIGDTAGLIHPLCGNGMSMAIHSAQICASLLVDYGTGKLTSRTALENEYQKTWQANFNTRLRTGRLLAKILTHDNTTAILMKGLVNFPAVLPLLIRKTHGKPLSI